MGKLRVHAKNLVPPAKLSTLNKMNPPIRSPFPPIKQPTDGSFSVAKKLPKALASPIKPHKKKW